MYGCISTSTKEIHIVKVVHWLMNLNVEKETIKGNFMTNLIKYDVVGGV